MLFRSTLVKAAGSLGLFALVLVGLSAAPHVVAAQDEQPLTDNFDARIAQDWMQVLYDRIWEQGVNAPAGSRLYAYAGVTLYEAVLGGMPGNNNLSGQLNDMPQMPEWDYAKVYDWPTVANEALAKLYTDTFFPGVESVEAAVSDMHDEWLEARSEEVSSGILNRSVEYGQQVAAAIDEWYADDGFYDTRDMEWEYPVGDPSYWVATNPNLPPVEPYWGTLRPFGLGFASECAIPLNVTYSEDEDFDLLPAGAGSEGNRRRFNPRAAEHFAVVAELAKAERHTRRSLGDDRKPVGRSAWAEPANRFGNVRDGRHHPGQLVHFVLVAEVSGQPAAPGNVYSGTHSTELAVVRPDADVPRNIRRAIQQCLRQRRIF